MTVADASGVALDRLAPASRAACATRRTGLQTWKDLLFVHWEVPADALARLLPPSVTVDTFEGRAFVGLVPFTMHAVRFGPLPVRDFLECNLRTYVHADGVPGVFFFSLDAESGLAVWGARTFYRLPYHRADMKAVTDHDTRHYAYSRRGKGEVSLALEWTVTDAAPFSATPGTLEHFLTERYALYAPSGKTGAYRVRVHHPAWPLHKAKLDHLKTNVPEAAGLTVGKPIDLVLATPNGVSVETFGSERVGRPL